MSAHLAEPLPECLGCEKPTRRDAYAGNGGLCSSCRDQYGSPMNARYAAARRRRA